MKVGALVGGSFKIIENINIDIDKINEEYLVENGYVDNKDVDIVIRATDDIDNNTITKYYINLMLMLIPEIKHQQPFTYKKNNIRYFIDVSSFTEHDIKYRLIFVNNKYKIVDTCKKVITPEMIDRYLQNKYGEELEELKIFNFSNLDNEDDICTYEWLRFR